ncbi:hypothetical protein M0654_08950 [Rhizobium sp. NTR19]|uniref:Succinoglycan biosynthesis transport protein n=1 Tax=Neorhizobium turbinariae TaxID=2937795 RepID=A0ABT0IQI4_9HYPH|nr:hypothetical protein [Neorhizobium turbinariae]MCK8780109.1 hypothetical protein [Neorhizobium turbinariae]
MSVVALMQHWLEPDQGRDEEAHEHKAAFRPSRSLRRMPLKLGLWAAVGLASGAGLFAMTPGEYSAETLLKVEGAGEITVANASSMLRSKTNLDNLVRALNLNGETARPSAVRIVSDIVTGRENTVAKAESALRETLGKAIDFRYDEAARQARISATAADPAEAARIANLVGQTFRNELIRAQSEASQPIVEKLRQTLERAEAALSGYVEKVGQQKVGELRRRGRESSQRAAEIAAAEARAAELKTKIAQASALKLADVLANPLPDALEYTGLDYQRQHYVEARLLVDQFSGSLGPRHPKLLAAQTALDEVRSGIQDALKRLVSSLRQQEAENNKLLADLKAKQKTDPQDKTAADAAARLQVLETAVREARENYLEAQQRAETQPTGPLAETEVIIPATAAAATRLGWTLEQMAGGGALAGVGLGAFFSMFGRRKHEDEVEAETSHAVEHEHEALAYPEPDEAADYAEEPAFYDDYVQEPQDDFDDDDYRPTAAYRAYPAAANDVLLGDQIRDLLMANRRPATEALPPLVAAVSSGLHTAPTYAPRMSDEERQKAEELRRLRQHMADLRERVELHSASRMAGRR